MANEKVRLELRKANKPQWWLADIEKVSADTICRRLRHELPAAEQNRLVKVIKDNSKADI